MGNVAGLRGCRLKTCSKSVCAGAREAFEMRAGVISHRVTCPASAKVTPVIVGNRSIRVTAVSRARPEDKSGNFSAWICECSANGRAVFSALSNIRQTAALASRSSSVPSPLDTSHSVNGTACFSIPAATSCLADCKAARLLFGCLEPRKSGTSEQPVESPAPIDS